MTESFFYLLYTIRRVHVKLRASKIIGSVVMGFRDLFSKKNLDESGSQEESYAQQSRGEGGGNNYQLSSWSQDQYDRLVVQRNFLVLVTICFVIIIAITVLIIGYIKNAQTVEPFVIEIEPKTGVPTVVDPVTIQKYSSDEAIKRYFVMQYIRAREEYAYGSYLYNYYTVVRVFSSPDVYYNDYRPKAFPDNKNGLYATCGANCTATVLLKSLIFQTEKSAQVRIKVVNNKEQRDKIVYMEFDFQNLEMNNDERMINPLGFVVTLYRIADENL